MIETIEIPDAEIQQTLDIILRFFPNILSNLEQTVYMITRIISNGHGQEHSGMFQDQFTVTQYVDSLQIDQPKVAAIFKQVDCYIRKRYSN